MSDTIDCPKCEHEHTPTGSDEEYRGEFTCEACGFVMEVEIEYDPVYYTSCFKCEYLDDWQTVGHQGEFVDLCYCVNCRSVKLKP